MQNLTIYDQTKNKYILKDKIEKDEAINKLGIMEHEARNSFKKEIKDTIYKILCNSIPESNAKNITDILTPIIIEKFDAKDIIKSDENIISYELGKIFTESINYWIKEFNLETIVLKLGSITPNTKIAIARDGNRFSDNIEYNNDINIIPGVSRILLTNTFGNDDNIFTWSVWNEDSKAYKTISHRMGQRKLILNVPKDIKSITLSVSGSYSANNDFERYVKMEQSM